MRARDQGETVQLSKIRMKESLRALLQKEAEAQRTTMNAVIADRLQRSFDADVDIYRGPRTATLFRVLAAMIESHRGDEWLVDPDIYNLITNRWSQHLDSIRPQRSPSDQAQIDEDYEQTRKYIREGDPELRRYFMRRAKEWSEDVNVLSPAERARYSQLVADEEGEAGSS